MIRPEQLYEATNHGLEIIKLHYRDAEEAARTGKPFRIRKEATPSASCKLLKGVYKVTDFGDDGRAKDPIQIHMEETGLNFPKALLDLCSIFGIADNISVTLNRPDIRKTPATEEEKRQGCFWEWVDGFTDRQCAVMGPCVKAKHLEALGWHQVKFIAHVKGEETVYKYANENYPIFMRECRFADPDTGHPDRFYKVYEPLNSDKAYRFSYQPKGKKPERYINGYREAYDEWKRMNEREEKEFFADPANEGKPYKEKKLDCVVICSGERDSLCVASMGDHPVWFNSETYNISEQEFKQLSKIAERIYNIPDIDHTGKKRGREVALKYLDIYTIWLPESLKEWRDNRGKPRKDFRDWQELNKGYAPYRNLKEGATPAKFWYKTQKGEWTIEPTCLFEFLRLNGFYMLHDENNPCETLVRVTGSKVSYTYAKAVKDFVRQWAVDNGLPLALRTQLLKTSYLGGEFIRGAVQEIDLDFTNYTPTSQIFYFPKFGLEVTGKDYRKFDYLRGEFDRYVHENDIIPHDIRILPPMFEITYMNDGLHSEDYDIEVKSMGSKYFGYLINSSRLHWRKELEGNGKEDLVQYRKDHKFDIAGPRLSPAEIREQKRCLISKIFTIGYLLHRYKDFSKPWAPFIMDNLIGEDGQCNGRSGKSFMFHALNHIRHWKKLSGRNPKLLENQFCFAGISRNTDFVLVDDCDLYLPFKDFYDTISSDMRVEEKGANPFDIRFADSPKFAFTTNYVPRDFDGSSVGRWIFGVCSDYYHAKSEDNDYLETRSIKDDFGQTLYTSSYAESDWEADINFWLQCVRFYLSIAHKSVRIEPDISNIIFRKYLTDMGDQFREWAEGYFALWPDANPTQETAGEHLDTYLVKEEVFEDYRNFSGLHKLTMQKFTKSLKGFCFTCGWVDCLDPENLCNSSGRILRRVKKANGQMENKQHIYIRSKLMARKSLRPDAGDTAVSGQPFGLPGGPEPPKSVEDWLAGL